MYSSDPVSLSRSHISHLRGPFDATWGRIALIADLHVCCGVFSPSFPSQVRVAVRVGKRGRGHHEERYPSMPLRVGRVFVCADAYAMFLRNRGGQKSLSVVGLGNIEYVDALSPGIWAHECEHDMA